MAEQEVALAPGESKVVTFEAIPHEARTYQVSVNGLTGSFMATAPEITVSFDSLDVWDIEGVPFVSVGMEAGVPSGDDFITWYNHWNMAQHNMYLTPGAKQVWNCAGEDILIQTASDLSEYQACHTQLGYDVLGPIVDAFMECGVTLVTRYGNYSSIGDMLSLARDWVCYRTRIQTDILTAYLTEPIVMDKIRGISMTVVGKADIIERYIALGQTVMTENYLWYQPTFAAPMPPPAFRGDGNILYQEPSVINATGVFARGYYYPGIYDGKISIRWFSSAIGREGAVYCDFRVKNLARVTGEGVI